MTICLVVQPSQLPKKILASAGVQVDLDSLEPTHDGKAPLELVGNVRLYRSEST